MDILGMTFRSLDLSESFSKVERFQEDLNEAAVERQEVSKEALRLIRQTKEESRSSGKSETRSPRQDDQKSPRLITLDEVAWHDTADSCWLVIYDYVYDCTKFFGSHPGGSDVLLEYAGRDATLAFIGTGHSSSASKSLDRYLIGELPPEERIFRTPGGVKVVGL